jgi:hypothetical protein
MGDMNIKRKPGINFLHEHKKMQSQLHIDDEHVIIDRKDWLQVLSYLNGGVQLADIYINEYFNQINKTHMATYLELIDDQNYKNIINADLVMKFEETNNPEVTRLVFADGSYKYFNISLDDLFLKITVIS